jgi:hypothetical protein
VKLVITCLLCLILVTALAFAIGYQPTSRAWGADGIRSMTAVGAICLGAAVVGFLPTAFIAATRPTYIGQAALGATVLRLLVTITAGGIYQTVSKPHLPSFLLWAVVFYCLLLAVETGFGVVLIRRSYPAQNHVRGVSA